MPVQRLERLVMRDLRRRLADEQRHEKQRAGGAKGYARNFVARRTADENRKVVERAARSGLTKKETAREHGLNIKTVRKHWPSSKRTVHHLT